MTLIPSPLTIERPALEPWGAPEDVGAETLDGPVELFGAVTLGSLDAPVCGGVYSATRGRFRVVYPYHEHATVIEGELVLTDEETGVSSTFGPGDSWTIAKGTSVIWEVRSASVLKTFLVATADL